MIRHDDVLEIAINQFANRLQTSGKKIYAIVNGCDDAHRRSLLSLSLEKDAEPRKIVWKRSRFGLLNCCRTQLTHLKVANNCSSILATNETVAAVQMFIDNTNHKHAIDFELELVFKHAQFDLLPLLTLHGNVLKRVIVPREI